MEMPETIEPEIIEQQENKIIETKNYHLNLNEDKCLLSIDLYSNDSIEFKVCNISNINILFYSERYMYLELIKSLLLSKEHYENAKKIFELFDYSIINNKIFFVLDENKNILKLYVKRELENEVKECYIILEEKKMQNEQMLKLLFQEINELNINMNLLKKENEEMKKLLNSFNEENKNKKKKKSN